MVIEAGRSQREDPRQVVESEPGIDHVLDHDQVAARDVDVQILEQTDSLLSADGRRGESGELDEVDRVRR